MTAARSLVLLLFFLSGACGLAYEVVWTRMMTHVFGSTALAVGTVLAAFMSGLALGGWLLGRLADRSRDPLRLYARLEIGVGVAALGAHFFLDRITPAYLFVYEILGRSEAALGVSRFVLAFVFVLAPTLLMGATLPVLARYVVTRLSNVGAELSTLYTVNVAGAVSGVLLTGFHLIGAYGIHVTVLLAAAGNIGIGVVAWIAAGRIAEPSAAAEPREDEPDRALVGRRTYRLLLAGLAISGVTSFAYEIYWTRSLVFLLGNSTYAVTTMLTAFLAGLALGGYLVRFLVDRVADRVALFGWIQVLLGVTAAVALPLLFAVAEPERIRIHVVEAARGSDLATLRFGVALLLMLVPAMLIGTTFPLLGRIGVADLERTGSTVGRIYAVNTAGNVVGALLPGLVLLNWFGIQRGILGMALLNAGVGFTALFARLRARPRLHWVVTLAALGTALLYAQAPLEFRFPSEAQTPRHRVLYYREGPSATTMVLLDPEWRERTMSVDGIDIGGTSFTEYKQLLLAHLPKILADDVSRELSIGLGSGILAGESARHDGVEHITCVEIEPSVVEGAAYFERENHGVLKDARVQVVVDDVANYLRTTRDRYQVISADEKTAQEYASNGFSYSLEYYELLRARLAPGGMVVQWVPTTLPPGAYRMILRTFTRAFPEAQLWYFQPAHQDGAENTLLVGSNEPVTLDLEDMRRRMEADPDAFASLARYGLTTAESVLTHFVAEGSAFRTAVALSPVNTLAHPRYEFYSPEDYAVPRMRRHHQNHEFLLRMRRSAPGLLAVAAEGASRMADAFAAEEEFLAGFRIALTGGQASDAFRHFEAAVARAPWNENLRARVFLAYWEVGQAQVEHGDLGTALSLLDHALSLHGESAVAHAKFAQALRSAGRHEQAAREAQRALELDPELLPARRLLETR